MSVAASLLYRLTDKRSADESRLESVAISVLSPDTVCLGLPRCLGSVSVSQWLYSNLNAGIIKFLIPIQSSAQTAQPHNQ